MGHADAPTLTIFEQRANPEIDGWPIEKILVPTLIVQGTRDTKVSRERSAALAARIPDAKFVTIEGGDHLASFTRAAEVSSAIDRFVGGLETRQD